MARPEPRILTGFAVNETEMRTGGSQARPGVDLASGKVASSDASAGGAAARSVEPWSASSLPAPGASLPPPGRAPLPSREPGAPNDTALDEAALGGRPPSTPWLALATGMAFLAPALLLYHRITARSALANATRREALAFLAAKPGSDIAALAAHLGLSFKSARHHAFVLARTGHIRIVRDGRRTRLFLPGDDHRAAWAAAMRQPTRQEVAFAVRSQPGMRQSEVAARLGLGRSTVHRHVRTLVRTGVLDCERGRLYPAGGQLQGAACIAPAGASRA